MKKLNPKGFSAIEAILIIVIVGLIGGVGYFIYSSQKDTKETLDNAANSQSASQDTTAKPESTNTVKFLELKEYGIKFKLSEPIADAYYVYKEESGLAIGLRSLDHISSCKVQEVDSSAGPTMVGLAVLGWDVYDSERISQGEKPENSGFKNNPNAVRIGNDWYAIDTPGTDCASSDSAVQTQINAAKDAFATVSKTIIAIN